MPFTRFTSKKHTYNGAFKIAILSPDCIIESSGKLFKKCPFLGEGLEIPRCSQGGPLLLAQGQFLSRFEQRLHIQVQASKEEQRGERLCL